MDNINSTKNDVTVKIFDAQKLLASFSYYDLYRQEGSKTDMKFLSESEVENHITQIRKYPKQARQPEDELSFRRLHTACATNGRMLAICMAKTYELRQYEILNESKSAEIIIEKYPGLMDFFQIKDEFERVKEVGGWKFVKGIHKLMEESNPDSLSKRRLARYKHQFWKDKVNCSTTAKLRNFIYTKVGGDSIKELIVYKLADEELRKEFERVVGKDVNAFERKIHSMLQKYCYGALALKNKLCYAHRECYDARRILETKEEEEDRKLSAYFILLCCSETSGKWVHSLFQKEQGPKLGDDTPYSRLLVKGNVFDDYSSYVYLQDKTIMIPPKFHQAFLSCFYLNIVLHIELHNEVMLQMFQPLWQLLMSTPDLKKEIYKLN